MYSFKLHVTLGEDPNFLTIQLRKISPHIYPSNFRLYPLTKPINTSFPYFLASILLWLSSCKPGNQNYISLILLASLKKKKLFLFATPFPYYIIMAIYIISMRLDFIFMTPFSFEHSNL